MGRNRRRGNLPKRRQEHRAPRQRFLVLSEGDRTEPDYFRWLRDQLGSRLLRIEPKGGDGTSDPLRLVRKAAKLQADAAQRAHRQKDTFLAYDQVWCLVDVDDHTTLEQAAAEARKADIQLAVSNPCFELWALLHLEDQQGHIERNTLRERLRVHMPDYGKQLRHDLLVGRADQAVERARRLDGLHASSGRAAGSNPSTGVWRLVEILLQEATPQRR